MSDGLQIVSHPLTKQLPFKPTHFCCSWSGIINTLRIVGVRGWVYSHCLYKHLCFLPSFHCILLYPGSVRPPLPIVYLCLRCLHDNSDSVTFPDNSPNHRYCFCDSGWKILPCRLSDSGIHIWHIPLAPVHGGVHISENSSGSKCLWSENWIIFIYPPLSLSSSGCSY